MKSSVNRYREVSEKAWQAQVEDALRLHGWRYYHTWQSLHSAPGFPDLVCIRPKNGDHFVAELKREQGTLTPKQAEWLTWFELAGWDAFVWRPSQVDEMLARVRGS